MIFKLVVCLIGISSICGCAFKEPATTVSPSPDQQTVQSPALVSMGRAFEAISREAVSGSVGRVLRPVPEGASGRTSLSDPFVLSSNSNEVLVLNARLTASDGAKVQAIEGVWTADAEGRFQKAALIALIQADPNNWKVQITPPEGWGKGDDEAQGFVHLFAKDLNSQLIQELVVPLTTPPSRIRVTTALLDEEERLTGAIPGSIKVLRGFNFQVSLIEVIHLKNESWYPVHVNFSPELNGVVKTSYRKIDISTTPCDYARHDTTWDQQLSDKVFSLPMEPELPSQFRAWIDAAYANGSFSRVVPPGEEIRVGIFASGGGIDLWKSGGLARPSLSTMQAPVSCTPQCRYNVNYDFWKNNQRQGWPNNSQSCPSISCKPDSDAYDRAGCYACFKFDLSLSTSFSDPRRYCNAWPVGNQLGGPTDDPWVVNAQTSAVSVGTQSFPAHLTPDPNSKVVLSFATPEGASPDTSRQISGLVPEDVQLGN